MLPIFALAIGATAVEAQGWPNKPIKLIVTFAPGGGSDAFARPLITKLSTQLGQQVVIDNRGGAGGTVGADVAAKSAPDGYTFMVGTVHHTVAVSVYKSFPMTSEGPCPHHRPCLCSDVLLVNNKVPAKNVKELIAYAKSNAGKLNYYFRVKAPRATWLGKSSITLTDYRLRTFLTRDPGPRIRGSSAARSR